MSKPQMNLIGEDGNIYAILGRANQLLKREGMHDEAKEMYERVTSCHSYEEALCIVSEYVETELSGIPQNPEKKAGSKSEHER